MSLKETSLSSSKEILDFISQFNTNQLVIIVPNLDTKKRLVDDLAKSQGTVPDVLVLRLSEYFPRLVQKVQPEVEFLDKKLFQNFLRQEFDQLGMTNSDQYLIEKAVEYISVYAPILALEKYRSIFEEYLQEDEIFKDIYAEMYPLMTKVWDMVLSSPYLINQWSLGWLYKNIEKLSQQNMDVVIFKPNSLKRVELDFFEEMSHYWDIHYVKMNVVNEFTRKNNNHNSNSNTTTTTNTYNNNIGANSSNEIINGINNQAITKNTGQKTNNIQNTYKSSFYWHQVTTPLDEVELLSQLILKKGRGFDNIKIIIPKKKTEYIQIIELYLSFYYNQDFSFKHEKTRFNFHIIRQFIEEVLKISRIDKNEFESYDLKKALENFKGHFKNNNDFNKHTSFVVNTSQMKPTPEQSIQDNEDKDNKDERDKENHNIKENISEKEKSNNRVIPQTEDLDILDGLTKNLKISFNKKLNFYQFLIELEGFFTSSKEDKLKSNSLKKMIMDWCSSLMSKTPAFIELSIDNWFLYLQSIIQNKTELELTKTILPIQFLEDVEFSNSYKYFILGCSQQNYESSNYAYLSDLEIDKLKADLGFNFESKEFSEQFYADFLDLLKQDQTPEIHFISSSYSMLSDKENDAKFLNQLYQEEHCDRIDHKEQKMLSFKSIGKINCSDINLNSKTYINLTRKYQSASSIQKYINCPYTYFCEYVLGIKPIEDLDLEPNSMLKGRVYHNALEKFLDSKNVNEQKILNFIKSDLSKSYPYWKETALIEEQMKASALKLKEYVLEDTKLKDTEGRVTKFKELDSSCYLDIETGFFSKSQKNENDIKFIGKIDRIDINEEKIYILDYKLSDGKSLNDWKKNYLVQMPIYGLMFIDGVLPIKGELSQLSYIAINQSFKYKNGLSVKHKEPKFNLGMYFTKANSQPNYESFKKELDSFRSLLKSALYLIHKAEFSPSPLKKDFCYKCDWKDTCHAKHLY